MVAFSFAWTERKNTDGSFDRPKSAIPVIDKSKYGTAFFGIAIDKNFSKLYAANFGENLEIKAYNNLFKPLNIKFDIHFDDNRNGIIDADEYTPFNIQNYHQPKAKIIVAYAKTMICIKEEVKEGNCELGKIFIGEDDGIFGVIRNFN